RRPILESMFMDIRICNKALASIHYLEENNVDPNEINDLKGQAHFIRGYCHFTLAKIWGPMPYITKVVGPDDQWDIPRLSKHETFIRIAQDFDSAYTYFALAGKIRRDNPVVGGPGHLTDSKMRCPNGVAAKAFKARALLYAASPLNNENGVADWQDAAAANWEALQLALDNGYRLQPNLAERKKNFCGADYTNEDIWAFTYGNKSWNAGELQGIMPGIFVSTSSGFSGVCPTQNFVDKYETRWGDPLNTQAERDAAASLGHYNEQDMYADRDPRLNADIIYNQQSSMPGWTAGKAQIWMSYMTGSIVRSELYEFTGITGGVTRTGYYGRKYNWGNSRYNTGTSSIISDPLCRLAELYLNYAEAANEAYGPTTAAPGATMTAEEAVREIRTRVGMPGVLAAYTGSKEAFRERVKNERNIELAWEGHYYFDIRRWMDAPKAYTGPLYGVEIEKVANSGTYSQMFVTRRVPLSPDRQIKWKEEMYYLPFNTEDNFKMRNFVPNPVW
ncbi:MAG TPA: RagB/SusD family nutrient uptake outer membrane protein, partial [Bacteroidales bacterium]|nr:RagB/SusD family nutrient uptake outer membrane protein [Bacteroidales bacterium]